MLRIIKAELYKHGQSFLDEIQDVDWGGDPEPDMGGMGGRISPDGVINERNYEEYEPSAIEDPIEQQLPTEPQGEIPYQREIPTGNEELGIPRGTREVEYDHSVDPETGNTLDQQQLINDGEVMHEVISFDYTNRFGQYAGTRTVEPHYTFFAKTTGNHILVTFDRGQNDIRAFIIGNIHPYGVRYEGVKFEPKGEIMKGESNGQNFGTAYPTVRHS